ncbi:MAG: hypothetical protein ABI323_06045 [Solirubrobacteraceae bacterium]
MSAGNDSGRAVRLMEILGLSEDELCRILDAAPLTLLSGQLDHRPELPILLTMLDEAQESADASVLRRWVRVQGPAGRPLDALLNRDFAVFEDALAELGREGFVLRVRGRKTGDG